MSLTAESAITVYDPDVDRLRLARYYLESELPTIINTTSQHVSEAIGKSIDNLSPAQVWRLLEAVSSTYRVNGVFLLITDRSVNWQEVDLPLDAITMTGTKPHINEIVYSSKIQRNPRQFAAFLKDYFKNHPDAAD